MKPNSIFKCLLPGLTLAFITLSASADVVIDGLRYVITPDEVSVSADEWMSITTANIRATVTENGQTYTVTKIDDAGFLECMMLTSVTMPNTITAI